MGASGETKEQTAKTARKGERPKQAQTVAGAGQTAKATKEILLQRQPIGKKTAAMVLPIHGGVHIEINFLVSL